MKRWIILVLHIVCFSFWMSAQSNLQVGRFFTDDMASRKNVTVVEVKSRDLKAYKLTAFKSITIDNDAALAQSIENCVKVDAQKAIEKETGLRGGRLYYGFYTFSLSKDKNSYIFYRNNRLVSGAKPITTIVYMEGTASLKELKNLYK